MLFLICFLLQLQSSLYIPILSKMTMLIKMTILLSIVMTMNMKMTKGNLKFFCMIHREIQFNFFLLNFSVNYAKKICHCHDFLRKTYLKYFHFHYRACLVRFVFPAPARFTSSGSNLSILANFGRRQPPLERKMQRGWPL